MAKLIMVVGYDYCASGPALQGLLIINYKIGSYF